MSNDAYLCSSNTMASLKCISTTVSVNMFLLCWCSWTSFKLYSWHPCWVRLWIHRCQKTWLLGDQVSERPKAQWSPSTALPCKQASPLDCLMWLEKKAKAWCNAGESLSLRVAEFPSRVPTAASHTPSTSQRGWASLKTPPEEHNRCVDALCASIIYCLSSHSLHTVCGPCGDKQNDVMHKSKQR